MLPAGPSPMPSVTGGEATSGNGDSAFSAGGNKFGGLNYNKGLNTSVVVGAAVFLVAIGAYVYVQK